MTTVTERPKQDATRELLDRLSADRTQEYRDLVAAVSDGRLTDQSEIKSKLRDMNVEHEKFVQDCSTLMERVECVDQIHQADTMLREAESIGQHEQKIANDIKALEQEYLPKLRDLQAKLYDSHAKRKDVMSKANDQRHRAEQFLRETADPSIDEEVREIQKGPLNWANEVNLTLSGQAVMVDTQRRLPIPIEGRGYTNERVCVESKEHLEQIIKDHVVGKRRGASGVIEDVEPDWADEKRRQWADFDRRSKEAAKVRAECEPKIELLVASKMDPLNFAV